MSHDDHEPAVGLGSEPSSSGKAPDKAQRDLLAPTEKAPAQATSTKPEPEVQIIRKGPSVWSLVLLVIGIGIGALGLMGGFMYGDYYGRQHAQYDNPALRDHYAGQCYQQFSARLLDATRETIRQEFAQRRAPSGSQQGWVPSVAPHERRILQPTATADDLQAEIKTLVAELNALRQTLTDRAAELPNLEPSLQRAEQLWQAWQGLAQGQMIACQERRSLSSDELRSRRDPASGRGG